MDPHRPLEWGERCLTLLEGHHFQSVVTPVLCRRAPTVAPCVGYVGVVARRVQCASVRLVRSCASCGGGDVITTLQFLAREATTFISHGRSRVGAPNSLLRECQQWLAHPSVEVDAVKTFGLRKLLH